jgi:small GTP-binding protein
MTKKQIALIGDRGCGKTALAVRLSTGLFLDYYLPTQVVDDFTAEIEAEKGTCKLTLLDLAGSCQNDGGIRSLAYKNCDAVVVCFDLSDHASLETVTGKWLPELEAMCPGVPFILAGCKQDESCNCDCDGACPRQALTRDAVKDLLINTRARAYVECSSKFMDGVDELAQLAVMVAKKKRTAAKKLASSIKSSRLLKKLSSF